MLREDRPCASTAQLEGSIDPVPREGVLHVLAHGQAVQMLEHFAARSPSLRVSVHEVEDASMLGAQLHAHPMAVSFLDAERDANAALALAQALRAHARGGELPLVVLCGPTSHDGSAPDLRRRPEFESAAFLVHPVDDLALHGTLRVLPELHHRRLELEARHAEHERLLRLNATMLSALSHDIRTPLTALTLNAELLIRRGDPSGPRVKAAAALLSRQVDHLVNLARMPSQDLVPRCETTDVGRLVAERAALLRDGAGAPSLQVEVLGDADAEIDPALLARAVDHLLLQAATYAMDEAVQVVVDGQARRSLAIRIHLDRALDEAANLHLFGDTEPIPGVAMPRLGPGLVLAEGIARAHGGSLIGRSKEREGTLLELVVPRRPLQ